MAVVALPGVEAVNTDLMFSSDAQDWRTPPEFLELVRKVGPIALDPCTSDENPCEAQRICTGRADGLDGLAADWRALSYEGRGLAYVNPPYGNALPYWSSKISDEGMRGCEVISLTPARTDTGWFRKLTTADQMCFWKGRIKFFSLNPLTGKWERGAWNKKKQIWCPNQPAAFPSLVSYWGPHPDRFREVFGPFGWCPL